MGRRSRAGVVGVVDGADVGVRVVVEVKREGRLRVVNVYDLEVG